MNVVVTGATSFIGSLMVKRLLAEGHQVFAVIRPGSRHMDKLSFHDHGEMQENLHVIPSELGELDQINRKIRERCQIYFHFGWDGSGSGNRTNREVQQRNTADSLKALEGAKSLGCRRFIFSGSQAEYGIHKEAMTEELICNPISEYGKAKVEFGKNAANLVQKWRLEGDLPMEFIHTRIFSIYGPGDHPWSLVESCIDAFTSGKELRLGECTQQWNYLYVDDLADALMALMNMKKLEESVCLVNIAGDAFATRPLREYVEKIYRLCGGSGGFKYGVREPNAEGPANLIPDISRLKKLTGWTPAISFEEGIGRILEEKKRM